MFSDVRQAWWELSRDHRGGGGQTFHGEISLQKKAAESPSPGQPSGKAEAEMKCKRFPSYISGLQT